MNRYKWDLQNRYYFEDFIYDFIYGTQTINNCKCLLFATNELNKS